jgi:hypothetical protein
MRLYSLINENGVNVEQLIYQLSDELQMERNLRDAKRLLGNQKEILRAELRIAQAELLLSSLRFGRDPL